MHVKNKAMYKMTQILIRRLCLFYILPGWNWMSCAYGITTAAL